MFIGPPGFGKTHLAIGIEEKAIDRIIHHSHLYLLGGDSYRPKQKVLS